MEVSTNPPLQKAERSDPALPHIAAYKQAPHGSSTAPSPAPNGQYLPVPGGPEEKFYLLKV